MSNALALAGVTFVLRDLLNDGLINSDLGSNVAVTARPPLREPAPAAGEQSQLNLFLYQIMPNAAGRNLGLPSRDFNGARVANAPLALNLHYLVTAYDECDYHAEILLGYAMQLLHENPGLSREQLRASLKMDIPDEPANPSGLPAELRRLNTTGLADQIESLKITPHYLTTEEMSRLWTGFQAPYRPSVACEVTVVLLQADKPVRAPLPVRLRNLVAVPFAFPVLEEVSPLGAAEGDPLELRGVNLSDPELRVVFGDIVTHPASASPTRLTVKVPPGLRAGVNAVRVARDVKFDVPTDPHGGFESNSLAFQLVPSIQPVDGPKFTAAAGAALDIAVTPAIAPEQNVRLLIGDQASVTLDPRDPRSAPRGQVQFTIPASLPKGDYLLRLRVDGADSVLRYELDLNKAAQGKFTGPRLTVT